MNIINIKGLDFQGGGLCPEQYDVWDSNDNLIGYVRLRWGRLTCVCPDVGGECVYKTGIGDGWTGCFESEEQRMYHLDIISDKILEWLKS